MGRGRFLMILGVALIAAQVPYLGVPLKWLETYFHEISHGLAALATGGEIVGISLHFDGSGVCTSQGGWPPAVAFAGYAGAALWGALLYRVAAGVRRSRQRPLALVSMAAIALTWLLWGHGLDTALIVAVCIAVFGAAYALGRHGWASLFIAFVGASIVLSAIRSPLALLVAESEASDAAALSRMTLVPELVWVVLWCLCGLAAIVAMWRAASRQDRAAPGAH